MARKSVEIIEKEYEIEEARYIIHLLSNKMAEVTVIDTEYFAHWSGEVHICEGLSQIRDLRQVTCHGGEVIWTDKIVKIVKTDVKKHKKIMKIKKTTYKQLFGKDKTFYSKVKNA